MPDIYSLASYQYDLPDDLIARHPCTPRDASRLMIIDRQSGAITEERFHQLPHIMAPGESLVFNDAKVIPARLLGRRSTGGETEILLVRRLSADTWEAIGRPGKKLRPGARVDIGDGLSVEVLQELEGPKRLIRLHWTGNLEQQLETFGELPLPPYLRRAYDRQRDPLDYQTVLARHAGAAAAPTAALHFSEPLLQQLKAKGIDWLTVTLDVSLGTFQPVQVDDIRHHQMHAERYRIDPMTSQALRARAAGPRQICVGTTCCRVLESAAEAGFPPGEAETAIFIYPGYSFKYVRALLTNFHAPASSLLMLVSAFAGYDLIHEAYAKAVERRFRFLSFGDAMLIK